ncbi:trans-sulfuration enzyme family protein [Robertmurraya massiliosenegalensis]|uniref:trans-sulfuration enzyme family protein n=1 Tax=Robertmurraya massiliosenegalensis TaxID=1287657 RepID=UPI0002D6EE66|nr:aminotransferase class I/II-fold pyridoxal phosphate-dependent enzyme [Robertmurraya massiliosenegalensis]
MAPNWKMNTRIIHEASQPDPSTKAISHSIVPAVAYAFPNAESAAKAVSSNGEIEYYGRYGNPTLSILEGKIAVLEGGESALGVSSGMAAISTALLGFLKIGDHAIVTKDIYGGTFSFLNTFGTRYGIEYDFIDCTEVSNLEKAIRPNTRVVYIETPSNPMLTVLDIQVISKFCKENELTLIVDNTFMSPCLQNPLKLGADIVVHSATKYINGHGDVIAGFIVGKKNIIQMMRKEVMGELGQNLSAYESSLILRGLKTLGVRMERHCSNARKVAKFLESHEIIKKVYYPGLTSHSQYLLAKKQMKDMGGIVSFELKGDLSSGIKFINSLKLAMISFSLGDPETLVQHPASMTHASIPPEERRRFGITDSLIRLSVGLEEAEDIILDLDSALLNVKKQMFLSKKAL